MNDDTDSLHWDPSGERLVALCRNAHLGVDRQDEIDYWYRLGQRDAYAYAAGVVIARGVDSEAFSVAERLTGALTQGVADLAPLRSVVLDPTHRTAGVEAGLTWMGPAAFHAQFPPAGVDHDFGMRWGGNGDQRLSLRLPAGRDHGLLYAYDPTWDEYAVLCRNASSAAVEGAFARALQSDIPMSRASFGALVAQEPTRPYSRQPGRRRAGAAVSVTSGSIDVAAVRAHFPIEQVVRSAGVELRPTGRGLTGCCPFHDDSTPSLSVAAIPDRFTCFGCGAHGDVIDFVQRLHGLSFVEAVRSLTTGSPLPPVADQDGIPDVGPHTPPTFATSPARGFEINAIAWRRLSTPVAVAFADSYLRHHRGIDLHPLRLEHPHAGLAGHAGHGWTTLTDQLRYDGVSEDELVTMDLARATRTGSLVDTLRDRLIFPVTDPDGRIHGFIGRDLTDDPRAPKYRNPTRTPTFEKSALLYRPTHPHLTPTGSVVVVEGVLDALALAAAASAAGRSADFAPCTTSGVTVTPEQAGQVLGLAPGRPPVIAMDGDEAGAEGSARWLTRICLERHAPALITRLPAGLDPADWIRTHGATGLAAFDREGRSPGPGFVAPALPGRELARIALAAGGDRLRGPIETLLPVAVAMPPEQAAELLTQAEGEITRQGWNPNGVFSAELRRSALEAGVPWHPPAQALRVVSGGSVAQCGLGAMPSLC